MPVTQNVVFSWNIGHIFYFGLLSVFMHCAVFVFSIWKQVSVFFSSCYKMYYSRRAK